MLFCRGSIFQGFASVHSTYLKVVSILHSHVVISSSFYFFGSIFGLLEEVLGAPPDFHFLKVLSTFFTVNFDGSIMDR